MGINVVMCLPSSGLYSSTYTQEKPRSQLEFETPALSMTPSSLTINPDYPPESRFRAIPGPKIKDCEEWMLTAFCDQAQLSTRMSNPNDAQPPKPSSLGVPIPPFRSGTATTTDGPALRLIRKI
jgi:hypothetical protein